MGNTKHKAVFPTWLRKVLDNERSPRNAFWIDRHKQQFAIRWVHEHHNDWTPDCAELFGLWQRECSRSRERAYKNMKVNFRMNLQSKWFRKLDEVPFGKGGEAVRRYQFVKMPSKSTTQEVMGERREQNDSPHQKAATVPSKRVKRKTSCCENYVTSYTTTAGHIQEIAGYEQPFILHQPSCQYAQPIQPTRSGIPTVSHSTGHSYPVNIDTVHTMQHACQWTQQPFEKTVHSSNINDVSIDFDDITRDVTKWFDGVMRYSPDVTMWPNDVTTGRPGTREAFPYNAYGAKPNSSLGIWGSSSNGWDGVSDPGNLSSRSNSVGSIADDQTVLDLLGDAHDIQSDLEQFFGPSPLRENRSSSSWSNVSNDDNDDWDFSLLLNGNLRMEDFVFEKL